MPDTHRRPSDAARRFGYLLAAAITAALWFVLNVRPGWQELSFLTEETRDVLWLVNLSLVVGVAANVLYAVSDPRWLKALGDLVTTGIGLAVLVRVWQVFPFDFEGYSVNWAFVVRAVLVVGIGGSIIGMLVQLVTFIRLVSVAGESADSRREVHQ
jgi:hypothetical protein